MFNGEHDKANPTFEIQFFKQAIAIPIHRSLADIHLNCYLLICKLGASMLQKLNFSLRQFQSVIDIWIVWFIHEMKSMNQLTGNKFGMIKSFG